MEIERSDHLQRILDLQAENITFQAHIENGDAERLALVHHIGELQQQVVDAEVHVEEW